MLNIVKKYLITQIFMSFYANYFDLLPFHRFFFVIFLMLYSPLTCLKQNKKTKPVDAYKRMKTRRGL